VSSRVERVALPRAARGKPQLGVLLVCTGCALGVHWVCTGCAVGVHWVCTGCALGVHCASTAVHAGWRTFSSRSSSASTARSTSCPRSTRSSSPRSISSSGARPQRHRPSRFARPFTLPMRRCKPGSTLTHPLAACARQLRWQPRGGLVLDVLCGRGSLWTAHCGRAPAGGASHGRHQGESDRVHPPDGGLSTEQAAGDAKP